MAASAGHAVAYTIGPIFKHIINVSNIFLFNFCEQKFFQHRPLTITIDCNDLSLHIFEVKWPNYASGPKSAPNSDSFWVLLLLFNFCEQKFFQHGPITIAIGCSGHFLLIFEENWSNYATGAKSAPNSDSFWVRRLFNVSVWVFCVPNATILLFAYLQRSK